MEFNYGTFRKNRAIKGKLDYMLKNAKDVYVNSDAHSLSSIKTKRQGCYYYIKDL